jgi:phosphoenolpyruvate synthase/pyruvate phosphate dikinase
MIRAGLPVPGGFCVTTQACAEAAESVSIDFDRFRCVRTEQSKGLAARAREAFEAAPIPDEVAAAVIDSYRELGSDTPVAVRLSATTEDLLNASFAGQQDTYLNMSARARRYWNAARRCWVSLWTDRAVIHRSTNQIDQRQVRLAVVVQRMVDAELAGVLFTANPVTGRRYQAVIDASPGLAESRQAYDAELRRRHMPRGLLSDGIEPEAAMAPAGSTNGLAGTPASAGMATGIARVIYDPAGAHLEPGEILVAPSTDPGSTPLFLTAGALVLEMGGANSHGAAVAREYGIPAVVGVPGATRRIVTGQRITVEGAGGTITRANAQQDPRISNHHGRATARRPAGSPSAEREYPARRRRRPSTLAA